MKKVLLPLLMLFIAVSVEAQNLQLHYDMGKGRSYMTSTLEMFKTDKWGSTYYFVDMDYNAHGVDGVSLAYTEISRGIKFWDNPFEMHVEYNGGIGKNKDGSSYRINDAWLFGGNYTWHAKDFSWIYTTEAMYKTIRGKNTNSFQLTQVWTVQFFKGKVTFSGFADFWKEDNNFFLNAPLGTTTKFVFLSEPQIWYNVSKNFAFGSETEFASNFALHKGLKACPTAALKWTF
ncbi:MAG: DUF5020 family protein [Marinilabiliales bacterium]|nr:DUF5020 family protein [Marinilabiliales bacterium]